MDWLNEILDLRTTTPVAFYTLAIAVYAAVLSTWRYSTTLRANRVQIGLSIDFLHPRTTDDNGLSVESLVSITKPILRILNLGNTYFSVELVGYELMNGNTQYLERTPSQVEKVFTPDSPVQYVDIDRKLISGSVRFFFVTTRKGKTKKFYYNPKSNIKQ